MNKASAATMSALAEVVGPTCGSRHCCNLYERSTPLDVWINTVVCRQMCIPKTLMQSSATKEHQTLQTLLMQRCEYGPSNWLQYCFSPVKPLGQCPSLHLHRVWPAVPRACMMKRCPLRLQCYDLAKASAATLGAMADVVEPTGGSRQ